MLITANGQYVSTEGGKLLSIHSYNGPDPGTTTTMSVSISIGL